MKRVFLLIVFVFLVMSWITVFAVDLEFSAATAVNDFFASKATVSFSDGKLVYAPQDIDNYL